MRTPLRKKKPSRQKGPLSSKEVFPFAQTAGPYSLYVFFSSPVVATLIPSVTEDIFLLL